MSYDVSWGSGAIGANGAGFLAQGEEGYTVFWGDGTQEALPLNRDQNGDGVLDAAFAFHSWTSDGVYDVTVWDQPNDPSTPNVRLRAYCHVGDTDGTVVNATGLKDIILTGAGDDQVNAGGEADWMISNGGADTLFGGGGGDVFFSGEGDDKLFGGAGDDSFVGGDGSDVIHGDAGRDFIEGNGGKDYLSGGGEADYFVMSNIADSTPGAGADVIRDFQQGSDVFLWFLSQLSSSGGVEFIEDQKFTGVGGQIRSVVKNGETKISIDLDGDKTPDMQVTLNSAVTLTDGDFWLI